MRIAKIKRIFVILILLFLIVFLVYKGLNTEVNCEVFDESNCIGHEECQGIYSRAVTNMPSPFGGGGGAYFPPRYLGCERASRGSLVMRIRGSIEKLGNALSASFQSMITSGKDSPGLQQNSNWPDCSRTGDCPYAEVSGAFPDYGSPEPRKQQNIIESIKISSKKKIDAVNKVDSVEQEIERKDYVDPCGGIHKIDANDPDAISKIPPCEKWEDTYHGMFANAISNRETNELPAPLPRISIDYRQEAIPTGDIILPVELFTEEVENKLSDGTYQQELLEEQLSGELWNRMFVDVNRSSSIAEYLNKKYPAGGYPYNLKYNPDDSSVLYTTSEYYADGDVYINHRLWKHNSDNSKDMIFSVIASEEQKEWYIEQDPVEINESCGGFIHHIPEARKINYEYLSNGGAIVFYNRSSYVCSAEAYWSHRIITWDEEDSLENDSFAFEAGACDTYLFLTKGELPTKGFRAGYDLLFDPVEIWNSVALYDLVEQNGVYKVYKRLYLGDPLERDPLNFFPDIMKMACPDIRGVFDGGMDK